MRQFQPLPVLSPESGEPVGGYEVTITGSGFESVGSGFDMQRCTLRVSW